MEDSDLDSFNVSFIDIVKNFLGLLILILVLLQGSAALTTASHTPLRVAKDESPHPFSAPLRDYLHPLTDHYHVAGNRILPIDWGKLGTLVRSGALDALGDKGKVALFGDALPSTIVEARAVVPSPDAQAAVLRLESDLNAFRLNLTFPTLSPAADLPTDEQIDVLVGEIVAKTQNGARGVHFYVVDTGFPLFSAVHRALAQRHVCFRWYAYKSGETVPFARAREQLDFYTSRKCRVRRS